MGKQALAPNYVLIGMPASGKSSLGKRLAGHLGRTFLDTDERLKEIGGLGPGELNAETDFREFVRREEAAVLTVEGDGLIVATGGSVVYGRRAMAHLQRLGTLIYLEDSLARIQRRVGGLEERGVLLRPGQDFAQLYQERCRLYRRYADIIFNNRRLSPAVASRLLANILRFLE